MAYDPNFPYDSSPALKAQFRENFRLLEPASKIPTFGPTEAGLYLRVNSTGDAFEFAPGSITSGYVTPIIGDGGVLDDTNAILGINAGVLEHRTVIVKHATDPTQPVTLSVSSSAPVGMRWELIVDPLQTGTVTISVPAGWTLDGTVDGTQTLDGPGAAAVVIVNATDTVSTIGATGSPQEFSGDTKFKNAVWGTGDLLYGFGIRNRNAAANTTLNVSSADSSDLMGMVTATAAITVTIPAPASWANTGFVRVLNGTGGNITLADGANSYTLASGHLAVVLNDGSNIRIVDQTPAAVW